MLNQTLRNSIACSFLVLTFLSWTTPCVVAEEAPAASQKPAAVESGPLLTLETKHASILLNTKGEIASLKSRLGKKQYIPAGRPSSLLSLHEEDTPSEKLLRPTTASAVEPGKVLLSYPNGSVATVKVAAQDGYFRFQLVALTNRGQVDNVVWGPLDTTISGKIGDIIGVVRDAEFAIGMYPLDDNTIPGGAVDGD